MTETSYKVNQHLILASGKISYIINEEIKTNGKIGITMSNPFFFSGKITNPDMFVGREKELKKIFGYLNTDHTGQIQHTSIVGPRRIGKSSLLYHVSQIPKKHLQSHKKYRFIYLDLDSPHCQTLEGLLKRTLTLLEVSLPKKVSLERFYEYIKDFHDKNIWVVLIMDEFEHLIKRGEEFKDSFFESWRSLGNNNLMGMITASQRPLGELIKQGKLTSRFDNIFHRINIGEFTDAETRSLLVQSKASNYPFSGKECKEIIKIAGNHPARLQIVASLLYETKSSNNPIRWREIKTEAMKEPPFNPMGSPQTNNKLINALLWLVWDFPKFIGRAILVVVGRAEHTDEATNRMIGYLILVIALGLIVGLVPWPLVTKYIRRIAELFFQ